MITMLFVKNSFSKVSVSLSGFGPSVAPGSICTRPGKGGGGHVLAEWGTFEISQSFNFEHVFQGFLRRFEAGEKKKSWTVSRCVRQKGENFFLIGQILVTQRRFESKSSFFFGIKIFKKELLIGTRMCFVTKSMSIQRKPKMRMHHEDVLSERFSLPCLWLSKNGFSDFSKVRIFVSHFSFF